MVVERIPSRRARKGTLVMSPGRGVPPPATLQAPHTPVAIDTRIPLLSILVPTVPGREEKLTRLLMILDAQVRGRADVQLIVLRDNRSMPIGAKRNKMLDLANGEYIAFVDDDDMVSTDYVQAITDLLRAETPDVLCFQVTVMGYGAPKPCRYHPDLTHEDLPHAYHRKPNHLMVWRREIVAQIRFPEIGFGEDTQWAERATRVMQRTASIERALYVYQYDSNDNSSTPR